MKGAPAKLEMDKEILTTSQTAKLLGVSVRTAQMLIEGGALTSWKTPGGHRRVYRSDVLSFREGKVASATPHSARVLLLASGERSVMFEEALAGVEGCQIETHANTYAASFSIGSRIPYAVVVDLGEDEEERISFLNSALSSAASGLTKFIAVGKATSAAPHFGLSRSYVVVPNPEQLADVVRKALQDDAERPVFSVSEAVSFPLAVNEAQRLAALERSGLLDSQPDQAFDDLTWLASHSLEAPISLVTLLTSTHQHFKSRHGLGMAYTPRSWAFCNYTILQRGTFIVGDLSSDERFASNPAVVGEPRFRFYAGAPLVDLDGFALGSLCVIDYKSRMLSAHQERTLRLLARSASTEIRLRALSPLS
jgi:excisionase family DNA binding protein